MTLNSHFLELSAVTREDTGVYECMGENEEGQHRAIVRVNVESELNVRAFVRAVVRIGS